MWDFRLGSDSYCLGVIFRVDTGSLWHATEHMDGAVAFVLSGTRKKLQTQRQKFISIYFVDPTDPDCHGTLSRTTVE